MGICFNWSSNG